DAILNNPTLSQALKIISYLIPSESYLILNNRFLKPLSQISSDPTVFENDYTLVSHSDKGYTDKMPYSPLSFKGIYDLIFQKLSENFMSVISPVFVGSMICGYYLSNTRDIINEGHKIKRIAKAINISFNEMHNRYKQLEMKQKAEESVYVDQVTNLPNLRGSCKWFTEFTNDEKNHKKHLTISVYAIAKYKQIYENYGIDDAENAVKYVAEALLSANPKDCFIGHISENEYVVINYYDDDSYISKTINSATSNFFSLLQDFNDQNGKDYYVEVNCGCTVVAPGWNGTLASYIKFASGELYMNKLKMGQKKQQSEQRRREYDREVFSLLIEENMFKYCFQPIVDAKTGEIYGYEALMRTPESINMSPLDVLETASQTNRLYDIERATIFNVMEFVSHNSEFFSNRKIFINLIPGYFLNDEDHRIIGSKYGEYIDNFVFEITERNTVTDGELNRIRTLGGDERSNQVAIDDYGTGHSNIVNLLRYSPQIIKIDRFLISDVDKDVNKQMFIKSTIDFARLNGIKVLAEGVETSEELKTVVSYGVDFIQGYYTGRPVFEPIINIDDSIRQEIIGMNTNI
ncbi:MAG: EAL domain-containing protein, partial [Oscillospiraceae bacterium]